MQQLIELTGNPLVDNGLATIAALSKCKKFEDLTLRRIKNVHKDGKQLARNNMRLKSNYMVFTNSITQQPAFSNEKKISRYAKITTAILKKIGKEDLDECCEFCVAPRSLKFEELFNDRDKHFMGRDWFPLSGSIENDAQALPSGSRPVHICAKCLFAVQYLPQSSLLIHGLLTVFQSTSMEFWYNFVKGLVSEYYKPRLGASNISVKNKLETCGKKEGSREAIRRLLEVMETSEIKDPNTSMIMYQYNNGNNASLQKQLIPNFTLNFLNKIAKKGLEKDVMELTLWEVKGKVKPSYRSTFFNKITQRENYTPLYPSRKFNRKGASSEIFSLYQKYILGYSDQTLYLSYKIAQFLRSKKSEEEIEDLSIDIQRSIKKQNVVRKWIIEMAKEGLITFDEYYNMFIFSNLDRRNRWWLVKYYLLSESDIKFKLEDKIEVYNQEYKDKVVKVAKMIFDRLLEERGSDRFKKFLTKFAKGTIGRSWLVTQFERLADNNQDFDYSDNWRILCINQFGQEDIYQFLYLLRLLFTMWIYEEGG